MIRRASSVTSTTQTTIKALALTVLAAGAGFSQPDSPPEPYLACGTEPKDAAMNDTVASGIDADGYISLFDGATTKGWWQSCQTGHGGPAKWKVVPELKAIFSDDRANVGGVLMTNKQYLHYELVWDYWPSFGNDGGLFNRTPADGSCFQTVLDYLTGASLGGTWGERNFGHRNHMPFKFGATETAITIPGDDKDGEPSNWTQITAKMRAAGQIFDCPMTGCTQADWNRLWDMDGWNQLRLQFYGGTAQDQRVRMKFWFRKVGATTWIPVSADTTLMRGLPANYIGLQVHTGNRFNGAKGTWYRNIKYTPLTPFGERIYTVNTRTLDGKPKSDITIGSNTLVGTIEQDHVITITDA
ncbi:MAG TPA: family 16 glycoside hydrolase, partial [Fibrobacteria bacterium]|nr:family 16 glycoside hydrolase [Fibrobacteria bacterium]